MIRFDVDIQLEPIGRPAARTAILAHHLALPYSGDFFMANLQLEAEQYAIRIDGTAVGTAAFGDAAISLVTLERPARRYGRQVMERILAGTPAREAVVASWDHHHLDVFGGFADRVEPQAYQFELIDPADLREPLPGLTLDRASEADLPYLNSTGFQPDFRAQLDAGQVRVARRSGAEVGIGLAVPHILRDDTVDIGMFTNADARGKGIGRSILALLSREILQTGQRPVAGCWWRNWESRPTIEAAGLTCIGTILRFALDPGRFGDS